MGLLDKLLGRNKQPQQAATEAVELPPCPHTALAPRWEAAEDMGKMDKVSSYLCQACGATLTPEEAAKTRVQT
jgi:hypothetical protein